MRVSKHARVRLMERFGMELTHEEWEAIRQTAIDNADGKTEGELKFEFRLSTRPDWMRVVIDLTKQTIVTVTRKQDPRWFIRKAMKERKKEAEHQKPWKWKERRWKGR